jgi:hypothetical protein
MKKLNWDNVLQRVKKLLSSWRQRYITIIGRANIIKAQILPLITFVGTTLQLPESYEKSLNKEIFHFLWAGKSEKEKRTLCFKKQMDGGLAIPHIPSRLAAIKCSWIKRLKDKPGIFQLAFENKGIDWSLEASEGMLARGRL